MLFMQGLRVVGVLITIASTMRKSVFVGVIGLARKA